MIAPVCASTTSVASQQGHITVQLFVSSATSELLCEEAAASDSRPFGAEYNTAAIARARRPPFPEHVNLNDSRLRPLRRDGVLHSAAYLLRALRGGLAGLLRAVDGRAANVLGLVGRLCAYLLRALRGR